MNASERREQILYLLHGADVAISASTLAAKFSVSRQIIVGDIALLRAAGTEICATPRGYLLLRKSTGLLRQVACCHNAEAMPDELYTIVDHGCTVLDVIVDHPLYGQITCPLQLSTRQDVAQFLSRCETLRANPLSQLTEGIHLHTLRCPDDTAFDAVKRTLSTLNILFVPTV